MAPLLLLAGGLAQRFAEAERARFEGAVASTADAALIVVKRELTGLVETLEALATSQALAAGDIEAFHQQASQLARITGVGVILRDPSGRQIANTFIPWGNRLPNRSSLLPWDERVLREGKPFVTGHYVGITGGAHSFAVVTPVMRDEEAVYLLHFSVPAARLRDVLARLALPPDWVAGIVDAEGTVIARSRGHEGAVGQPATAGAKALPPPGEAITGSIRDRERREVFFAAKRSAGFDWSVAATAPTEDVLGPLRHALWTGAALAAVLLALSLLAAQVMGARLANAIRALAAAGAAFGRREPVHPPKTAIREVNEVGEALAQAAAARTAADQRQRLILQELNHRVKNTLATVQALAALSAKEAPDLDTYRARLTERLSGLARTQALLTSSGGTGAELRDLLQAELMIHDGAAAPRIELDGPSVALSASKVVPLGMLFHELATNAAKHGSLSVPEGRLRVAWTVASEGTGGERLDLTWEEVHGPPVAPPTRSGFGTQMIERGLARQLQARVAADYAREGLRFRLSMPLCEDDPAASEATPDPSPAEAPVA